MDAVLDLYKQQNSEQNSKTTVKISLDEFKNSQAPSQVDQVVWI